MKSKLGFLAVVALLIVILLLTRATREAKSDQMQTPYTGIVSVNAVKVEPSTFPRIISETGALTGLKEAVISAQTGGRVAKVVVDVGDRVKAGDPMVIVDDTLYALEAARAQVAFEKAQMDYDRLKRLHDQNNLADVDLEGARLMVKGAEVGAKMAKKTADDATIRAPFDGLVSQRFTEVGQMIERSMPAVQLVDASQMKLTINVTEDQIRYISDGAEVNVSVDAISESFKGRVTAVGAKSAMGARSFPVEVRIPGDSRLKSGMFARASIEAGVMLDVYIVPRVAVIPEAGRMSLFLVHDNMANKTSVQVVGAEGDRIAITGIKSGDVVITTGNQELIDGTSLKVTLLAGDAR